jgi:hypothetical protein
MFPCKIDVTKILASSVFEMCGLSNTTGVLIELETYIALANISNLPINIHAQMVDSQHKLS